MLQHWFTVERIHSDTFAISEYGHWEETHSYLLCGTERAVLIDTGLGVANIKAVVDDLTTLPVAAVLTHAHWDHIGGLSLFPDFAVHENEAKWLSERFPLPLHAVRKSLTLKPCAFPADFRPDAYRIFQGGADECPARRRPHRPRRSSLASYSHARSLARSLLFF